MLCSCSLTYISSTHCEVGAGVGVVVVVGVGVEWVGFFCDCTARRERRRQDCVSQKKERSETTIPIPKSE
jgi:hypothetical protein